MRIARALGWVLILATLTGPAQSQTWALPDGRAFTETEGAARPANLDTARAWPTTARLSGPTNRYTHDVLGGIPRWTDLGVGAMSCTNCRHGDARAAVRLPETLVFEDTGARLWDVTGDGFPEVVVVESHRTKGARLAIWSYEGTKLKRIAVTPAIGQANRWLAPLGVGDFNGDGRPDIAYVDRPHLARELVIVTVKGNRLVEIARSGGVTNHRIGDSFISGGVRKCGQDPEAILANADWSKVVAVQMGGGKLTQRTLGRYSARRLKAALACKG